MADVSGPIIMLTCSSSARYLATGCGCCLAEAMFEVADLHEWYWWLNPILKSLDVASHIYRQKCLVVLKGWLIRVSISVVYNGGSGGTLGLYQCIKDLLYRNVSCPRYCPVILYMSDECLYPLCAVLCADYVCCCRNHHSFGVLVGNLW